MEINLENLIKPLQVIVFTIAGIWSLFFGMGATLIAMEEYTYEIYDPFLGVAAMLIVSILSFSFLAKIIQSK